MYQPNLLAALAALAGWYGSGIRILYMFYSCFCWGIIEGGQWSSTPGAQDSTLIIFWSLPLFSSCDGVNPKGHRRINKGLIYISIVGVFWSCFTRGYQPTELLHSGHIQTKKQNIKHDLRNQRFCFEHSKPGSCKLGSARLSGAQRDSAGLRAFFAT